MKNSCNYWFIFLRAIVLIKIGRLWDWRIRANCNPLGARQKQFPPKKTQNRIHCLGLKTKKQKLTSIAWVQTLISDVGFDFSCRVSENPRAATTFFNSRIKKKISTHIGKSKNMPIAIAIGAVEMKPYEIYKHSHKPLDGNNRVLKQSTRSI